MINNLFVEKYRPKLLNEVILDENVKRSFHEYQKKKEIPNLLLAGNPGTGKTTLAKVIVKDILDCQYLYINASDENGIDVIRGKITNFAKIKSFDGNIKVIILDEADGITEAGQRALRNSMEEYSSETRFILTCNYLYRIIPAIQSRCQDFHLNPPLKECISKVQYILKQEGIVIPNQEQKKKFVQLIRNHYPDLRKIIQEIQKNVIDNQLVIEYSESTDFAKQIFSNLLKTKNPFEIRKTIIQGEKHFNNDYHQLIKEIFNILDKVDLDLDKKRKCLLIISEHLYRHSFVQDPEINCYSCILSLSEII